MVRHWVTVIKRGKAGIKVRQTNIKARRKPAINSKVHTHQRRIPV